MENPVDSVCAIPRYDRSRSYRWNYDHAPLESPGIAIPSPRGKWTYCNRPVPSPLAIAAGPLLNGRWILHYAALGFDILTYKTVRSRHRECYPLPNLQPVRTESLHNAGQLVEASSEMEGQWAVSFGMPSMEPSVWRADVEWTRNRLAPEKLLSVSVVATVEPHWTEDDLAADFAQCARWAVESGADCIETNFSCPNIATVDGQLFQQPRLAAVVAERVREAIGETPYLVKLGFVPEDLLAVQLIESLSPFADALAMTNCIGATIQKPTGAALFDGETRGIGGDVIRTASVDQVRRFAALIGQRGLPTQLIGVGGISAAAHVREYLRAGAEAIQIATAAMIDPLVACRIRAKL